MRFLSSLGLLLSVGISGCFLSGSGDVSECTAAPTCPEGTSPCAPDSPDCQPTIVCGETLYCGLPMAQCGAIPVCAPDEIEVPSCEVGNATCRSAELCGSTIFCDFCDPGDVCQGDILRDEQCTDVGPPCRIVEACGNEYVCQERVPECESECPTNMMQVGHCEISDAGCYFFPGCAEDMVYCVPAMGECSRGEQVGGPEECDPDRSCFFEDYGDRRVWCTGGFGECFAFPVCESHEHMLELLDPCPGSSQCRYETLCGLTVQCSAPLDVDG